MEGQNLDLQEKTSVAQTEAPAKVYPIPGSQPEHVFEDANDEAMGIETISYPNGGKSKRVVLSDGRIAITRRVKGKDMIEAGKLAGQSVEKVNAAVAAVATKIDDQPLILDDLLNMWGMDFALISAMSNNLNF